MLKLELTVIITTFNEVGNISDALKSVSNWVSHVIVVDSFSTDGTFKLVKNNFPEVKLLQRSYDGPANQKNWAIPQAVTPWVLLMDADERVSVGLKNEIETLLKLEGNLADAYWIGFTHFFMGKQIRYSGWQNDKTIRLILRDKCRYNHNKVHEEIDYGSLKVSFLKNKFDHYTFKNISHFLQKQIRYAEWSALDYQNKTGRITYYHLWLKPFFRFCKHFIIKLGFLDGKEGFIISTISAYTVLLRYANILQTRKTKQ